MRHVVLALFLSFPACAPPTDTDESVEGIKQALLVGWPFQRCPVGHPCRNVVPPYGTTTFYFGTPSSASDAAFIDVANENGGRATIDNIWFYVTPAPSPTWGVQVVRSNLGNFGEFFNMTNRPDQNPRVGPCAFGGCYYKAIFQSGSWVVHNPGYDPTGWPSAEFVRSFYLAHR
jgi:hypothetical protein